MRRNDKEINDVAVIEGILGRIAVCRVGMCAGDKPYVVTIRTLSFV